MKRRLLAAAMWGGACAIAQAQSNVTIYGLVDLSVGAARNGNGTVYNVSSGVGNSSRLGFRGTEDLGGGLKANFKLEMGMSADNGTISQGGAGFGRESWVGVSSSLGSVTLGRQYSPLLFVMAANDASTQAYWGSNQNAGIGLQESPGSGPGTGGHTAVGRVNNSVMGSTNLGPVNLMAMVALGDENARKTGRLGSLGAIYRGGPVSLGAGIVKFKQYSESIAATTPPEWQTTYTYGGSYDFKIFRAYAGYYSYDPADNRPAGTPTGADPRFTKTNSRWVGVRVPTAGGTLFGTAMRTKYRYAAIPEGSGTTLSVAYEHYLSKRTTVYASYGQVENSETGIVPMLGAATAVFPTKLGDDIRVLSLGLRHVF